MNHWTDDELTRIGKAEELKIAPLRGDGTPKKPVTIWVVRVEDDLYVRSWRGNAGNWYRGTQVRHEGQIQAGGVQKEVTFAAESDPTTNDQIDSAYQSKYGRYPQYVTHMVDSESRATTIKLIPRD